ncbi:MAG: hypothetical protein AAGA39_10815 [Pseudomonadota bacterium]
MRALVLLALLVLPASADQAAFYGTWGTKAQCARQPIKPGGTVLAEPVEISPEWLRQGTLWCRLDWFPLERREDGLFTGAFVHCGEDSLRSYVLGMVMTSDTLTLRWDLLRRNGPLTRCSGTTSTPPPAPPPAPG